MLPLKEEQWEYANGRMKLILVLKSLICTMQEIEIRNQLNHTKNQKKPVDFKCYICFHGYMRDLALCDDLVDKLDTES
jgi:hypothetical protein